MFVQRCKALAARVAHVFGLDELLLAFALALIALGCWDAWRPGSYLVPGLALLWIALPVRAPFIDPSVPKRRTG